MSELLNCPFCGGEATVERMGHNGYYFVACAGLNCCDSALADTEAEAIAAWNTRSERTCRIVKRQEDWQYNFGVKDYEFSCGHTIGWAHTYEPSY